MALASRTLEPLVVGKVIGDVVDMFIPAVGLKVSYGAKEVFNGCDIKVIGTVDRPFVQVDAGRTSSNLYTLIMVDPDYPSPSEPTLREWLHWMVTDIPGGSDATRGKEMVGYVGPQPPTGIHRYVFVLYKQKTAFSGVSPSPGSRSNFSSRLFSAVNDLGFPVAVVYFNSQKEPVNKKKQPAKRKLP